MTTEPTGEDDQRSKERRGLTETEWLILFGATDAVPEELSSQVLSHKAELATEYIASFWPDHETLESWEVEAQLSQQRAQRQAAEYNRNYSADGPMLVRQYKNLADFKLHSMHTNKTYKEYLTLLAQAYARVELAAGKDKEALDRLRYVQELLTENEDFEWSLGGWTTHPIKFPTPVIKDQDVPLASVRGVEGVF